MQVAHREDTVFGSKARLFGEFRKRGVALNDRSDLKLFHL
jgi:hypothetical protein